jgi:hypothetical protein
LNLNKDLRPNSFNIIRDDNFDDLLLFNININKKAIFKENKDIYIKPYNNKSINNNNIEIKDLIELNTYKEVISNPNKEN